MTEVNVVQLLLGLTANQTIQGVKFLVSRIRAPGSPLKLAIESTANQFPEFEALGDTLEAWCTGEPFLELLDRLRSGDREIVDSEVVDSFEAVGFYADEETQERADEILRFFLDDLLTRLYASPDGRALIGKRLDAGLDSIQEGQRRIISRLPKRPATLDIERAEAEPEDKQIDQAKKLIEQGQHEAAKVLLLDLRNEIRGPDACRHRLFRIATNLGAIAFATGDETSAIRELQRALELEPERAQALANAALAAMLQGNVDRALEFAKAARDRDPRDSHATSMYIHTLWHAGRRDEVSALWESEPWIRTDPSCVYYMAQNLLAERRFDEARELLTDIAPTSDEPMVHVFLAQGILIPMQDAVNQDPPLRSEFVKTRSTELTLIRSSCDKAVDLSRRQNARTKLQSALILRAAAHSMESEYEKAIADCDEVLRENPTNPSALHNRGAALLNTGNPQGAIDSFLKIDERDSFADWLLAKGYLEVERFADALAVLTEIWNPDGSTHQMQVARTLVRAAASSAELDIEEVLRDVQRVWGEDLAIELRAEHLCRLKKWGEAGALLERHLPKTSAATRHRLSILLGDVLYELRRYREAVDAYGDVVPIIEAQITHRYVLSLFFAGEHGRALEVAREVRGDRPAIPYFSEVEASVLEQRGDLEAAKALVQALSELEPQHAKHRVQMALLCYRTGAVLDARRHIESVGLEDTGDDPSLLMQIADLRLLLGVGPDLPFAYRARRVGADNPEIHLAYLGIMLAHGDDADVASPETVSDHSWVCLRRERETRDYFIDSSRREHRTIAELHPEDDLAKRLLGLRKGETVHLKANELEELSYEIVDVQSKFVRLAQETFADFTTRFPGHPGLHRVEVKDNDFSKVLATIDRRHAALTRGAALYRQGRLTLGALASAVGSPVVDAWLGLASDSDGRIFAALGNTDEQKQHREFLESAGPIVLDLSAILTLVHLELEPEFLKLVPEPCVPQAVLDAVIDTIDRDKLSGKPSGSMGKHGGTYFFHEHTEEELERRQEFLQRVKTFIIDQTRRGAASGLSSEEHQDLIEVCGRDAAAAVLVTHEQKACLLADDHVLRVIAKHQFGVNGFWTQTVLRAAKDRGILDENCYRDAVRKLAASNYFFVSINADDLIHALKNERWNVSSETQRLIELLRGPDCTLETAALIVAKTLKATWLSALAHQRPLVLYRLLDALFASRPAIRTMHLLRSQLALAFYLVPQIGAEVEGRINAWVREHLSSRPLV